MQRRFLRMPVRLWDLRVWCAALVVLGAASEADATLPSRVWGTYVGGNAPDYVNHVVVDAQGYVYIAGTSYSEGLATKGAHKAAPEDSDAFLVKYTPDGKPVWGTYIGGVGIEAGGILALGDGVVAYVGLTDSAAGIATPGAFQTENGGNDLCAFAAVFTTEGVRQWGTYLCAPGATIDPAGIAMDAQGAVYLVGRARAVVPGLTTPASHQPDYVGGGDLGDGYLAKFGAQGSLLWGTYYGGSSFDHLEDVSVNQLGEIYIAGATRSATGMATPGAHSTSVKEYDGFLARFTTDGARMWGTYYGGAEEDGVTSVVALPQGGAVVAGQTASIAGIATPGAHQPKLAGDVDNFLARFDAAGTLLWGTYSGAAGQEGPSRISVSAAGDLYAVGSTDSLVGLASADAWQTQSNGLEELFLASYDIDGVQRWGTYYGGSSYEFTANLAVTPTGDVYLVGDTRSSDGIASPDGHSTVIGTDEADGFLVRFSQATFGQPCEGPGDCKDGTCVDGVCCASACGGGVDDCQACAASKGAVEDGTCMLLGPDVICRAADGVCDLPEHCAGAVACPDDVMAADGEACVDGICMAGQCAPDAPDDSTGSDSTGSDSAGSDSTPTGEPTTGSGDAGGTAPEDSTGAPTTNGAVEGADGCGCRGAPGPSGPTGLVAALLLLLRRRRR
ncbi:MAG: SBBP repeat-containing protein [Nannocystis sp.]|nr:SBBP repeat-containing protein [Nannocystis sp.]MBA3546703.1 SBBP repeat-containing protein [Nannocystis sp.]